jgi:hypothetical protein
MYTVLARCPIDWDIAMSCEYHAPSHGCQQTPVSATAPSLNRHSRRVSAVVLLVLHSHVSLLCWTHTATSRALDSEGADMPIGSRTGICERNLRSRSIAHSPSDWRYHNLSDPDQPMLRHLGIVLSALTIITGPMQPTTMLQKMAGFARAAQWMYWPGVDQKPTGAMFTRYYEDGIHSHRPPP